MAGTFVWAVSTSDKYHHLARLPLLLRDEIVDRLQVKLVIDGQQVHIQHEQIPLPVHYLLARCGDLKTASILTLKCQLRTTASTATGA